MSIRDLKDAAELYNDYQILKELQDRLKGLITDEQRKIDALIAKMNSSPDFSKIAKDESDYFEAVKKSAADARIIVDTPVAPDVVRPEEPPKEENPIEEPAVP